MEELELPRRYRSIFIAGPTFNLLTTDQAASRALGRIRSHLADDGSALIPLFIPSRTPAARLGRFTEASEPDGAVIRVSTISERRDEFERIQETMLRYERLTGDSHMVEDRPWTLHWHTQEGFRSLAAAAGLRVAAVLDEHGGPATGGEQAFAFWLTRD